MSLDFVGVRVMLPWVPETFLARFPVLSSLYSDPPLVASKMCRPSANTENSRGAREKPLVPRVELCTQTLITTSKREGFGGGGGSGRKGVLLGNRL